MSRRDLEAAPRECGECGARLSYWYCEVCGGDTLDTVARAYVTELATPWRVRRLARDAQQSVEALPLVA